MNAFIGSRTHQGAINLGVRSKAKEAIAILLTVVLLLTSVMFSKGLFTNISSNADVVERVESYHYPTDSWTIDNEILGMGESIFGIERQDGARRVAFCMEFDIFASDGVVLDATLANIDLNNANNKAVNDIIYFRFTVRHPGFITPKNSTNHNAASAEEKMHYYFTQYYAWEQLHARGMPNNSTFPNLSAGGTTSIQPAYVDRYNIWKTETQNAINSFYGNIAFTSSTGQSGSDLNGVSFTGINPGQTLTKTSLQFKDYKAVNNENIGSGIIFNHAENSDQVTVYIPSSFMGTVITFNPTRLNAIGFKHKYADLSSEGYWVYWGSQPWQKYWTDTPPDKKTITFDILIDQTGSLDIIKVNDKNGQYDSFPLNDSPTSYTNNDLLAGSWWKLKGTTAAIDGVVEVVDKNLEITGGHRQFDNITRGAYTGRGSVCTPHFVSSQLFFQDFYIVRLYNIFARSLCARTFRNMSCDALGYALLVCHILHYCGFDSHLTEVSQKVGRTVKQLKL